MPLVDELATAVAVEMKSALRLVDDRLSTARAETKRLADELAFLSGASITMRERLAALEARPPVPGPPGADGAAGRDGVTGPKGDPGMVYRGVFQDATAYALGDVVTWAGGAWHCNEATTDRPGDGSHVWTLIVKRGRDAKGAR